MTVNTRIKLSLPSHSHNQKLNVEHEQLKVEYNKLKAEEAEKSSRLHELMWVYQCVLVTASGWCYNDEQCRDFMNYIFINAFILGWKSSKQNHKVPEKLIYKVEFKCVNRLSVESKFMKMPHCVAILSFMISLWCALVLSCIMSFLELKGKILACFKFVGNLTEHVLSLQSSREGLEQMTKN